MNKLTACFITLLLLGLNNPVLAAPPGKANILHCGCVVDGDGIPAMAFVNVDVSSKARGHTRHGVGTIDSCYDGVATYIDFERSADDCQIDGTPLVGLSECAGPAAGDVCGAQLPQ